ncbi:hypothetical protein Cs7R123_44500 [Catellatospora sp. TT07R-123]|uniref:HNH endonuclease n=1 Tax=Catellatospora sp. TT07R-123 TaxID=2733863 RepID=UPI001B2DBAF0|nr:HNH endonuclease signature motif containing protein [Catellatospora sp. TT07R-123]GHJ47108.1 hypothetical protein Cs7R123_44500 [Catellatospora sp. TT07R-123]
MTGPLPPGVIGYRGGDNTPLRWSLFKAWDERCYSCGRPLTFPEVEIDHIIPRDTDPNRLADLIKLHGLHDDFHVDRPANLAPACSHCNSRKSNRDLLAALITTTLLDAATGHAAKVERHARSYPSASAIAKAFVKARYANPYDPRIRQVFIEHAPEIVRIFGQIDEEKASDFASLRHLDVSGQAVIISIDKLGRFALRVVTDICADSVECIIESVLDQLITGLDQRTETYCRESLWVGTPTLAAANTLHLIVTSHHRDGPAVVIRFLGGLLREFDVAEDMIDPSFARRGHYTAPERVQVGVTFEMTVRWNLAAPGDAARTVVIDSAEYEFDEIAEVFP